jgi:hypothetical protein
VAILDNNEIWAFCDVAGKKKVLFGSENMWKEY